MIKYRVKRYYHADLIHMSVPEGFDHLVDELIRDFGLGGFDRHDVFLTWHKFSKDCSTYNWITPDRATVEEAFNVELEMVDPSETK